MRRGLRFLNITEASEGDRRRWLAAPMKVACDDHNGHNAAYMAKWDGTKWDKRLGLIEPPLSKFVR